MFSIAITDEQPMTIPSNASSERRPSPSPRQLLHEALASLRGLGRRSLLALLGIVMGCSSVIAMLNI
ncbi:hypothetical protein Q4R57_20265, partial [Morganella morganii]